MKLVHLTDEQDMPWQGLIRMRAPHLEVLVKVMAIALFSIPAFASISPSVAQESEWKTYKSRDYDGMIFSAAAPPGWTVTLDSPGSLTFTFPKEATSDGPRSGLVTFGVRDTRQWQGRKTDRIDLQEQLRLVGISTAGDRKRQKYKELEARKTELLGHETYYKLYTNQYVSDKIYLSKNATYDLVIDEIGFEVRYTTHPELFEKYRPVFDRIMQTVKVGPWSPTIDPDGSLWQIYGVSKAPMTVRGRYWVEVDFLIEYPADWIAKLRSRSDASKNREQGSLTVDFAPAGPDGTADPSTGTVSVWIQGLPVKPHGLADYLALANGRLAELGVAAPKATLETVHLPLIYYFPRKKNRRWSGSGKIYRRTYAGNGTKYVVYMLATPTVAYHVLVSAPEAKFDALRPRAEAMVRTLDLKECEPGSCLGGG